MRFPALLVAASLLTAYAASASAAPDARLDGAYKFNEGGWTYVHLQGAPAQIGFQHGYLLARQIEDNVLVYKVEAPQHAKHKWSFFRDAAKTVLWPHLDAEYQQELTGIAAGLKAHASALDLWDVVALNGYIELSDYYVPWLDAKRGTTSANEPKAPGKCSAFIATGSATKGGKIVIAHNNWSSYAEGERWTVVFDIVPSSGQHILMDGMPGVITSQDDFGVNASGLMITETTLPMIKGFDVNDIAEFDRSRKAMQYATSIDEYAAIMRKGNNGGYANSWLIGDRKTGEIAYLELGLKNTPLTRKKDGYFVSSNFAADPALIRDDTLGFDPGNAESTMNARHIRAEQFMKEHYGELDTALAEAYLSDHYDTYEHKIDAGKRSLCVMTARGPQVLEFNTRFGDPETQAILIRMESDLLEALEACVDGRLASTDLRWTRGPRRAWWPALPATPAAMRLECRSAEQGRPRGCRGCRCFMPAQR